MKEYEALFEAYQKVYEQAIGIPLDDPTDAAAARKLREILPPSEKNKVIVPKNLQKAHYEPEGEVIDENIYDQVLEYLLDDGYSEKECNQIMVQLVSEGAVQNFFKTVQQRTGIGKPGVGPGQVARNVLKAGISDILGTSIATGSTPSSVSPAKSTPSSAPSPTAVVRTVKSSTIRNAPTVRTQLPDPWKQPSAPRSSTKSSTTTSRTSSTPKALTGSPTPRALSGSQTRAALPSGVRGGALVKASPGGAITPTAKPGALVNVQKPSTPTTTTRALPGTNIRGLLSQGARNALPDPWKDVSNAASNTRNMWNRVQQAIKPQAQLKPSQANARGLLQAAKPTTSVRSQQFQDVQRLNRMMGGGLMGELPKTNRASQPAPKTTGNVDKLPPKPSNTVKPSVKPNFPGGPNPLNVMGLLAGLSRITPAGVAAAVSAPRPTADGTLTAAMKRGDVAPSAPKLPPPEKPKASSSRTSTATTSTVRRSVKSATKPSVKPAAQTQPEDPDLKKYDELRKTDPAAAKELGMKIWTKKYRPAFAQPEIA
jgi:hypothetical protein